MVHIYWTWPRDTLCREKLKTIPAITLRWPFALQTQPRVIGAIIAAYLSTHNTLRIRRRTLELTCPAAALHKSIGTKIKGQRKVSIKFHHPDNFTLPTAPPCSTPIYYGSHPYPDTY